MIMLGVMKRNALIQLFAFALTIFAAGVFSSWGFAADYDATTESVGRGANGLVTPANQLVTPAGTQVIGSPQPCFARRTAV